MIKALFVGTVIIVATMGLAAIMFEFAIRKLKGLRRVKALQGTALLPVVTLSLALIWVLLLLTISIWSWAVMFVALGLFETVEPALYFAIVSFTTVGYGDVVLEPNWRLLAGMTATNGLLIFGLFTAFLVEILEMNRGAARRRKNADAE